MRGEIGRVQEEWEEKGREVVMDVSRGSCLLRKWENERS